MYEYLSEYLLKFARLIVKKIMEVEIAESKYGIRVGLKKYPTQVVYSAVSMNCGTRDESESKSGLVHFMEHMLFKGTSGRGVKSINNRLEAEGGELNAFTSKEDLVVNSTVLKSDMSKALDLMLELVFDSTYPQVEMDKERGVVAEEIKLYKDNPIDDIYDSFEELIFSGHPLSRPILGTARSLKGIHTADMLDFASRFFVPSNIVVTVLGDVEMKKVLSVVDHAVERYYKGNLSERFQRAAYPVYVPNPPQRKEVGKRIHQAHAVCGKTAFSLYDERRVPASLLVNILGGPAVSAVLNQSIREKRGLVYTIEANYTPFRDTGLFTVYFGCDKSNLVQCEELVKKEMDRFMTENLSDTMLKRYKKQYLGQVSISNDNLESNVLGMGKSISVYGRVATDEEIRDKINAITADDIRNVARELFSDLTWLIYK